MNLVAFNSVDDANVTSAFADLHAGQFEVRVLGAYRGGRGARPLEVFRQSTSCIAAINHKL
jgi:hypothetical protein